MVFYCLPWLWQLVVVIMLKFQKPCIFKKKKKITVMKMMEHMMRIEVMTKMSKEEEEGEEAGEMLVEIEVVEVEIEAVVVVVIETEKIRTETKKITLNCSWEVSLEKKQKIK